MKKFVNLFTLAMMVMVLCSCTQEVPQPVKIDKYLYEITMDDYRPTPPNELVKDATKEFSCSAVRNGNYYGRNLDFFISETSLFVVHTTARDDRHASLGVARLFQLTDNEIDAGLTKEQLDLVPWGIFDGINDAGLFCNMNVTPAADAGIPHTQSNPGKPEINCIYLVRALLDNCATVDEAIELVNNCNVIGSDMGGFDLHFMIGDPEKNVVLEFIDNKAVFKEEYIMTNFFVTKLPEYTPNATGIERYNILKEHYAEGGESMQGMWNLLKRVKFSQAYDPETVPFWCSDNHFEGMTLDTPAEEVIANEHVSKDIENFRNFKETGYYTQEMHLWFTEHNSTYDIANRKLWLTMRENYDKIYKFSLE